MQELLQKLSGRVHTVDFGFEKISGGEESGSTLDVVLELGEFQNFILMQIIRTQQEENTTSPSKSTTYTMTR
jgi:hypothetical protein